MGRCESAARALAFLEPNDSEFVFSSVSRGGRRIVRHLGTGAEVERPLRLNLARAGSFVSTWLLFLTLLKLARSPFGAAFAQPLVMWLLAVSIGYVLYAFRHAPGPVPPHRARKIEISAQVSLYLLTFCSVEYWSAGTWIYPLSAGYLAVCLLLAVRTRTLAAASGPALLFIAWLPAPAQTGSWPLLQVVFLLAVSVFLGRRSGQVRHFALPAAAAFVTLLDRVAGPELVAGLIAVGGLLALYGLYRVSLLVSRVTQFNSLLLDLAAVPGLVALHRASVESPARSETALWVALFFAVKFSVLGLWLLTKSGLLTGDHGALAAFPRDSQRARRYNNLWFALVASLSSTGIAFAAYVNLSEPEPRGRIALFLLIAAALVASSQVFNRAFVRALGAGRTRKRRATIGRFFDSRVLRLTAMALLSWSLWSAVADFRRSSYTQELYDTTQWLDRAGDKKGVREYLAGLEGLDDIKGVAFSNSELSGMFLLLSASLILLLYTADRELVTFSYFSLRGVIPLAGLLALRKSGLTVGRVVRGLPVVGGIFQAFAYMTMFVLMSFDQRRRVSLIKLVVLFSTVLFAMSSEYFVDRLVMVASSLRNPEFLTELGLRDFDRVNDLVARRTCVAYTLLGFSLYGVGVAVEREYLRTMALVIALVFIGLSVAHVRDVSLWFPAACAAALIAFAALVRPSRSQHEAVGNA